MNPARKKAYFYLLCVTIIWGAAMPVVKPALEIISPYQFLFLRFLLATPLMAPVLLVGKYRQQIKLYFHQLVAYGLGSTAVLILVYLGLERTSSLEASFISNLSPLILTFLGIILLKEKEESREWKGLILAMVGTSILILEPLFTGNGSNSISLVGNLLVLLFVLSDALVTLVVKVTGSKIPKILVSAFNAWVGMVVLSIFLTATGQLPSVEATFHPASLLAVIYMGTVGTVIAFRLYHLGFQLIEASEAGLFAYLRPLVYVPLGVIWLKEEVTGVQVIGLLISFAGVVLAEYRPRKKSRLKA
jgi:drug/metabolite transporter (DMT)-like permease